MQTILVAEDDPIIPLWQNSGEDDSRRSKDRLSLGSLIDDTELLAEAMVNTVRECLLVLDGALRVRLANRNFFLSFQVIPEETLGRLVFELGNGQWNIPGLRRLLEEILPQNNSFRDFEITHNFPQLGLKTMVLNAQRLRRRDDQSELILLAIQDVTAMREKHRQDAYSAAVFRSSGEALVGLSAQGFIQTWNPAAERLYGYTTSEAIGFSLSLVVPHGLIGERDALMSRLNEGEAVTRETVHVAKDGRRIDVLLNTAPVLDSAGQIIGISAALTDITERKRREEEAHLHERQLSQLLKEKELLVAEVHHRVKNNLCTVISLLNLHAGHTSDPGVIEALSEAGGRVQAIARLHESLYASNILAEINFGEYLWHLADELRALHGRPEILFEMESEDIVVSMEAAVPLGLIANELMVNCLKHAFPSKRAGHVKAVIEYVHDSLPPGVSREERLVRLRVEDDGVGFSPKVTLEETNTLGLKIVRLLSKQLNGQLEFRSVDGVQAGLTFLRQRVG